MFSLRKASAASDFELMTLLVQFYRTQLPTFFVFFWASHFSLIFHIFRLSFFIFSAALRSVCACAAAAHVTETCRGRFDDGIFRGVEGSLLPDTRFPLCAALFHARLGDAPRSTILHFLSRGQLSAVPRTVGMKTCGATSYRRVTRRRPRLENEPRRFWQKKS